MRSPEERAAAAKPEPRSAEDILQEVFRGGHYLRVLNEHIVALRKQASPDPHGNQQLFLDDVVIAHLVAFFNPAVKSLRTIEDFSRSPRGQKYFTAPSIPRSTLSDFHKTVDPALVQPIIARLHAEARAKGQLPTNLPETVTQLLAIDGTFFAVASNVAWAVQHTCNNGVRRASVRVDVHLDVATWVPEVVAVHGNDVSEAESSARHVQPGSVRIQDRGILSFKLLQAEIDAGAFFVHRLLKPGERTPKLEVVQEFSLTQEQRDAGVVADRLVRFVGSEHRDPPTDPKCDGVVAVFREVVLASPGEDDGEIRLLTNLMDRDTMDAATIGQLYRYRWQVELFFRWLKTFAHFKHLISHSRTGVTLAIYVAVIAALLICVTTNTRPSKYAYLLLGMVVDGSATLEDILPILKDRHRQIALDKASKARRAAKKKSS